MRVRYGMEYSGRRQMHAALPAQARSVRAQPRIARCAAGVAISGVELCEHATSVNWRTIRCSGTTLKPPRRRAVVPAPNSRKERIAAVLQGAGMLLVAAACCMRLALLVEAMVKGRYVSVIRGRPTRIFLLEADPQRYWIAIGWDAALTGGLLVLLLVIARMWWLQRR
ncbi:hypothetical protein [Xanthomonas campestris]|uniref:hypothetical protein n=3 Tax=Xanthomonas campestris TaxID=339 RepID=UPI002AD52695|nr:hypothetical protein [Xanthomonas campestris]MEA0671391.1 hypothetical protein [Xanthomonas campestris pv. campestris]MEB2083170.1 hypothetical protein [Xanthomonas campestris pv. campestris]MEB2166471.1 hypothetical protein [Xanthomonas campestris pv. campestris]